MSLVLPGCDLLTGDDRTPTTVKLTPSSLSFDAVGETAPLGVEVLDQHGAVMEGVDVEWSASDHDVAEVSPSGVVTSAGNGVGVITATAGSGLAEASISVRQVSAALQIASGSGQEGPAGEPLTEAVGVRVLDAGGTPAEGVTVVFEVEAGGGSVAPGSAVTGTDGIASATWRLGEVAGEPQRLRARVVPDGEVGGPAQVQDISQTLDAIAVPGAPDRVLAVSGDGQSAQRLTVLPQDPTVQVVDRFDNPVPNVLVEWSALGGGSVTPQSSLTDDDGGASTTWTLGASLGLQQLQVSIPGGAEPVVFEATSVAVPVAVEIVSGDEQVAPAAVTLPEPLVVRVTDTFGNPVEGVDVSFDPGPDSGAPSPSVATSEADGLASTQWTLGSTPGVQTVTASIAQGASSEFSATATGSDPDDPDDPDDPVDPEVDCSIGAVNPSAYDIEYCFVEPVSAEIAAVFEEARQRWSEVIVGDQADIFVDLNAGQCGLPSDLSGTIDDLFVVVEIAPNDGPGGVLGSAGPCGFRNSNGLAVLGIMIFDEADVATMLAGGYFDEVIVHELGHVIGIGTGPRWAALREDPVDVGTPGVEDTHFTGAQAIAAFDAAGGSSYTGGAKVPIENNESYGPGTYNGHWRESVFDNELMTGFISTGTNPLSWITGAALADMGYVVSAAGTDDYALPTPGLRLFGHDTKIKIEEVILSPSGTIDHSGSLIPTPPAGR